MVEQQPWTCYIGESQDSPACSSMNPPQVAQLQVSSCNCSESWDQRIMYHFWGNDTKRFISFVHTPNLVTGSVEAFFNLQVHFNCKSSMSPSIFGKLNSFQDNSSQWGANSSIIANPNLWLLVYDPVIAPQQAYLTGTAGLSLINANGVTTVTLTPTYVQRRDSPPHYEYEAIISTSSFLNIICDVATRNALADATSNAYADCTAFILFRFANLDRTTFRERPVMEWADVVASIGSYFALVQFVC